MWHPVLFVGNQWHISLWNAVKCVDVNYLIVNMSRIYLVIPSVWNGVHNVWSHVWSPANSKQGHYMPTCYQDLTSPCIEPNYIAKWLHKSPPSHGITYCLCYTNDTWLDGEPTPHAGLQYVINQWLVTEGTSHAANQRRPIESVGWWAGVSVIYWNCLRWKDIICSMFGFGLRTSRGMSFHETQMQDYNDLIYPVTSW
jgi:hypothetical protein